MSKAEKFAKRTGAKPVLFVAPQPFFLNRGTPINVRAMVSSLAELGYEVDLLVYPFGESVELPGVRIHRSCSVPGVSEVPIGPSWRKILLDVFLLFKALRMVISKRYVLLHGVEEGGCIVGLFSIFSGTPYIFDMDSCMPEQLRERGFISSRFVLRLIGAIEAFFLHRACAVLTVCQALTEKVRRLDKHTAIYQIEDYPYDGAVVVNEQLVAELKKELGSDSRKVFVYTGNLEPYQGIDLLLRAFSEVCTVLDQSGKHDSKPLLVLVGGGSVDSPQVEYYRRMAAALGIGEEVSFTGSRPAEEMGSFMALADVLVSPRTEGENTPLKLYSYMAAAKPIIATRILSHTQVLDDESAYLAGTDSESFADTIMQVLDDTEEAYSRRESLVLAAKRLVETRYSAKEFKKRLAGLYRDVIGPAVLDEAEPLAESKQRCAINS